MYGWTSQNWPIVWGFLLLMWMLIKRHPIRKKFSIVCGWPTLYISQLSYSAIPVLVQWAYALEAMAAGKRVSMGLTTWTALPKAESSACQQQSPILSPHYGTIPQGTRDILSWDSYVIEGQRFFLTEVDLLFSFPIQNDSAHNTNCRFMEYPDPMIHYHDVLNTVASHQGSHLKAREMASFSWTSLILLSF